MDRPLYVKDLRSFQFPSHPCLYAFTLKSNTYQTINDDGKRNNPFRKDLSSET